LQVQNLVKILYIVGKPVPFYVLTFANKTCHFEIFKDANELIEAARKFVVENVKDLRGYREYFNQKNEDINVHELIKIMLKIGLKQPSKSHKAWFYVIEGGTLFTSVYY
jgi:hypothetical protein